MVTYSTNWMGPINQKWVEEHGDCWSAGRIDICDSSKEGDDRWGEYSLAPMHGEDWNALGYWLWEMQTEEVWSYEKLIEHFQYWYGKEIRWQKNG